MPTGYFNYYNRRTADRVTVAAMATMAELNTIMAPPTSKQIREPEFNKLKPFKFV